MLFMGERPGEGGAGGRAVSSGGESKYNLPQVFLGEVASFRAGGGAADALRLFPKRLIRFPASIP